MASNNTCSSTGFCRKATAPYLKASVWARGSSKAVRKMMGSALPSIPQSFLQFQAADPRHAHIQDHHCVWFNRAAIQKLLGRTKELHLKPADLSSRPKAERAEGSSSTT